MCFLNICILYNKERCLKSGLKLRLKSVTIVDEFEPGERAKSFLFDLKKQTKKRLNLRSLRIVLTGTGKISNPHYFKE